MSKAIVAFLAAVILWGAIGITTLRADSAATEEDIAEAFSRGEISTEQYDQLLQIIDGGANLSADFLSGNYDRADYIIDSISAQLEASASKRASKVASAQRLHADLKYRSSTELTEDRRSRYNLLSKIEFGREADAAFSLRRELTGRERWTRRSVSLRDVNSHLKRITIGNFTQKYGSGLIVGYRGKTTRRSDRIDTESFLVPDYGGFNGAEIAIDAGAVEINSLVSMQRDETHRHNSYSMQIALPGAVQTELSLVLNRLEKRNGKGIEDYKGSTYLRYPFHVGFVSLESAIQGGELNSLALLAESAVRFDRMKVNFTAWDYGDNYIDLSSGSRSATLSRRRSFESVDYEYSSRRSGQTGGEVALVSKLSDRIAFDNKLLGAAINRDSSLIENLLGGRLALSSDLTARVEYLHRTRTIADGHSYALNRMRLIFTGTVDRIDWRTYLSVSDGNDRKRTMAVFTRLTYRAVRGNRVTIWANFGEIETQARRLDYFYGYLSSEQMLVSNVQAEFKLAHRYGRSSAIPHLSTVTINLASSF